jgi:hypothetical protein
MSDFSLELKNRESLILCIRISVILEHYQESFNSCNVYRKDTIGIGECLDSEGYPSRY